MELAADAKTTQRGQVIEQGTRDAMHVAAALLGTQTTKNRAQVEAYNRQQAVQLTQEDLRASLTAHTRALLRGGEFDTSDLQDIVHDYLNSSGNPAYLGQWFRNTLMSATEPRTQKQLQTLAQSGKMLEFEDMLATLQQNQAPANKQQPIH
jgi:hypothetical protein